MIKKLLLFAALLATILFSSLAAPAASSAAPVKVSASVSASASTDVTPQVIECGGSIGQPQWRNTGSFRNTLGVSFVSYIYVYPGSYKYYCPNYIYVHSGKDILMYCYFNGSFIGKRTFTAYGWNGMPSWAKSASECDLNEYNQ